MIDRFALLLPFAFALAACEDDPVREIDEEAVVDQDIESAKDIREEAKDALRQAEDEVRDAADRTDRAIDETGETLDRAGEAAEEEIEEETERDNRG